MYVSAFLEQAERAKTEGRSKNAAAYLRAAEFFTPQPSQQKTDIYHQYHETFYSAFADEHIDRQEVPYNGGSLPAMQINADGTKGTILLFGGFDSLIEEFFVIWKFFAEAGYRVIAFEGPGQGGALQMYGHHFDHDYEKPVAAILDHAVKQAMYMVGGEQPMDAVRWLMGMNRQHINSEAVTQDVFLVGGENDAFQPVKLLETQHMALTNARSVSTRVFTKAEQADMHVQMGNLNLAMEVIEGWLSSKI